jgi:hypothetical protein
VMSGLVNRHNMRTGEPFEHERGSPEVNGVTAIHLQNAPFSVPITRSQWAYSFGSFLKDKIYASMRLCEDDSRAQARHRRGVFKN